MPPFSSARSYSSSSSSSSSSTTTSSSSSVFSAKKARQGVLCDAAVLGCHAVWCTGFIGFSALAQKYAAQWGDATGGLWTYDLLGAWLLLSVVAVIFICCLRSRGRRFSAALAVTAAVACVLTLTMFFAEPNSQWEEYFRITNEDALEGGSLDLLCDDTPQPPDLPGYVTLVGAWRLASADVVLHEVEQAGDTPSFLFTAPATCGDAPAVLVGCPVEWDDGREVQRGARTALSLAEARCGWNGSAVPGEGQRVGLRKLSVSPSFMFLDPAPSSIEPSVSVHRLYEWGAPSLDSVRLHIAEVDTLRSTQPRLFMLLYVGISALLVALVFLLPVPKALRGISLRRGGDGMDGHHLLSMQTDCDSDSDEVLVPL